MIDLIRTENFVSNGIKMIRSYYGEDEEHITGIIEDFEDKNHINQELISEQDELNAKMLLNQATIIAKQEEQDAVLAEILLNQMEVL